MSHLPTALEGSVERPHWSARAEDIKNEAVAKVLESAGWQARIQPYASYGSTKKVRVLARALYAAPSTAADHHDQPVHDMRSLTKRGFRNFVSQPATHLSVEIEVPSLEGPLTVRAVSDRTGIIDATIDTPMAPGVHQATIRAGYGNEVSTELHVVDDAAGVGVVSDIDDTVLVTFLPRPLIAAWNAFVINQGSRRVVPGMPVLYKKIQQEYGESTPFFYLSTGAWNVSPFLQRFLFKNGYPAGPLLLTEWGPTNTGIFRSGQQHKNSSLERLHSMFPSIQWLLIGDDGQHDPEIYGEFLTKHPEAVKGVVIRQLTEDQQDLAHGASRPLRAVGALGRSLVGIVPKVWKRTSKDTEQAEGSPEYAPASEAQAHGAEPVRSTAGDDTVYSVGEGSPADAAAPPAGADLSRTAWVAAPDGFGLIRALRRVSLMNDKA